MFNRKVILIMVVLSFAMLPSVTTNASASSYEVTFRFDEAGIVKDTDFWTKGDIYYEIDGDFDNRLYLGKNTIGGNEWYDCYGVYGDDLDNELICPGAPSVKGSYTTKHDELTSSSYSISDTTEFTIKMWDEDKFDDDQSNDKLLATIVLTIEASSASGDGFPYFEYSNLEFEYNDYPSTIDAEQTYTSHVTGGPTLGGEENDFQFNSFEVEVDVDYIGGGGGCSCYFY